MPIERAAMTLRIPARINSLTRLGLRFGRRPNIEGSGAGRGHQKWWWASLPEARAEIEYDAGVIGGDLLIVGAGPAGLATAIAAHKAGLDYAVLEKGALVDVDLPLPAPDDVLHHPRPPRDRGPALRHALREAHPGRGPALLPEGGRHLRPAPRARVRGHAARPGGRPLPARGARPARRGGATLAPRGPRHRLLRSSQSAGRARRRPAPRVPLLDRGARLLPPPRGGGGRQELRRHRRPRAPSRGRPRHPRPPPRPPGRRDQVLDQARHREPDQGRDDRGAVRDDAGAHRARARAGARPRGRREPARRRGVPAHRLPPRRAACSARRGRRRRRGHPEAGRSTSRPWRRTCPACSWPAPSPPGARRAASSSRTAASTARPSSRRSWLGALAGEPLSSGPRERSNGRIAHSRTLRTQETDRERSVFAFVDSDERRASWSSRRTYSRAIHRSTTGRSQMLRKRTGCEWSWRPMGSLSGCAS